MPYGAGWLSKRSPAKLAMARGGNATATANVNPTVKRWTAAELRKLPAAERDAILAAAAALAEADYRNDPALTAFEAFGKDDLYGHSSSAEPR
jgi:hypothetical protein